VLPLGTQQLLERLAQPGLGHSYEKCPGAPDHLGISSLEIDPDPIRSDAPLRVTFAGTPDVPIEGGNGRLDVSYYGVPLASLAFDFCKSLSINCPRKAGEPFKGVMAYHVPVVPLTGVAAARDLVALQPIAAVRALAHRACPSLRFEHARPFVRPARPSPVRPRCVSAGVTLDIQVNITGLKAQALSCIKFQAQL
jgi:hypothetical protein